MQRWGEYIQQNFQVKPEDMIPEIQYIKEEIRESNKTRKLKT